MLTSSIQFYYGWVVLLSLKQFQTYVCRSEVTTYRRNDVVITGTCWQKDIPKIKKTQARYTSCDADKVLMC
jgi:hypothetical protein